MSENLNIYEKLGDFILNLIQLTVGGIVFAAIMADDAINKFVIYIGAFLAIVLFLIFALILYRVSNKKKGESSCT